MGLASLELEIVCEENFSYFSYVEVSFNLLKVDLACVTASAVVECLSSPL